MTRTTARRHAVAAVLLLLGLPASHAAAADGDYDVLERWRLAGPGGWDYLTADPERGRLFVTRGDRVEVADFATGRVLATVPGLSGVHGVALAPGLHRGFASNGRGNSVTVFDYDTLAVLREVPIPAEGPDAIVFDPASSRVFTFNGHSNDATVLDANSMDVIAKLPMPGKPEFAASDGTGRVFVNIESDPGKLVVIDSQRAVVVATWPVHCDSPSGLAIDATEHRLFSVCDGKRMIVTDSTSGKQLARVAIGEAPDAVVYDPARALVLVSNGAGTLSVIHAESRTHYTVRQTLETQAGARTLALDPTTHRVYLATAARRPPPPPTKAQPHPRPVPIPGTFTILVAAPH